MWHFMLDFFTLNDAQIDVFLLKKLKIMVKFRL